jgi:hypothetical protein
MRLLSRILSCFILSVLFLIACTSKPEQALVGRWQGVGGSETMAFLEDKSFIGRLIWDTTKAPVNLSGTYSVEGDTVSLKPIKPADLVPMTLKVKLSNSNDDLTITFVEGGALKVDGSSARYQRIR